MATSLSTSPNGRAARPSGWYSADGRDLFGQDCDDRNHPTYNLLSDIALNAEELAAFYEQSPSPLVTENSDQVLNLPFLMALRGYLTASHGALDFEPGSDEQKSSLQAQRIFRQRMNEALDPFNFDGGAA